MRLHRITLFSSNTYLLSQCKNVGWFCGSVFLKNILFKCLCRTLFSCEYTSVGSKYFDTRPIHAAHATHSNKLTERKKSRWMKRENLFDVWMLGGDGEGLGGFRRLFLRHSSRDAPPPVGLVENVVADCRLA